MAIQQKRCNLVILVACRVMCAVCESVLSVSAVSEAMVWHSKCGKCRNLCERGSDESLRHVSAPVNVDFCARRRSLAVVAHNGNAPRRAS